MYLVHHSEFTLSSHSTLGISRNKCLKVALCLSTRFQRAMLSCCPSGFSTWRLILSAAMTMWRCITDTLTWYRSSGRFCGTFRPGTLISTSNTMMVEMVSDSETGGRGLLAYFNGGKPHVDGEIKHIQKWNVLLLTLSAFLFSVYRK